MARRQPTVRREARRRAKELLRDEEIERRARQQLPKLRERASTRRELRTQASRWFFGI